MVTYLFVVPEYVSDFGQELRVVGNLPELGSWNAEAAPAMQWCEGHRWKLDISLPKSSFEFKVVMMRGDEIHWELGVNRFVQAEADCMAGGLLDDAQHHKPVEIMVKVSCQFNQTDATRLALMVPMEEVQEAFEVEAKMLDITRHQLQRELQRCQDASPSQQRELHAMRQAMVGHSTSVASLSSLMESAGEEEHCVTLPVGRINIPRGASVQILTQLAAASFLPPGTEPPPSPAQLSAQLSPMSWPLDSPSRASIDLFQPDTLQQLQLACQRLSDFFDSTQPGTSSNRSSHESHESREPEESSQQMRRRQLMALAAEAKAAWFRAHSLCTGEEGQEVLDLLACSVAEPGLQGDMAHVQASHAYAWDQLARRFAAGSRHMLQAEAMQAASPPRRHHCQGQPAMTLSQCIAAAARERGETTGMTLEQLRNSRERLERLGMLRAEQERLKQSEEVQKAREQLTSLHMQQSALTGPVGPPSIPALPHKDEIQAYLRDDVAAAVTLQLPAAAGTAESAADDGKPQGSWAASIAADAVSMSTADKQLHQPTGQHLAPCELAVEGAVACTTDMPPVPVTWQAGAVAEEALELVPGVSFRRWQQQAQHQHQQDPSFRGWRLQENQQQQEEERVVQEHQDAQCQEQWQVRQAQNSGGNWQHHQQEHFHVQLDVQPAQLLQSGDQQHQELKFEQQQQQQQEDQCQQGQQPGSHPIPILKQGKLADRRWDLAENRSDSGRSVFGQGGATMALPSTSSLTLSASETAETSTLDASLVTGNEETASQMLSQDGLEVSELAGQEGKEWDRQDSLQRNMFQKLWGLLKP